MLDVEDVIGKMIIAVIALVILTAIVGMATLIGTSPAQSIADLTLVLDSMSADSGPSDYSFTYTLYNGTNVEISYIEYAADVYSVESGEAAVHMSGSVRLSVEPGCSASFDTVMRSSYSTGNRDAVSNLYSLQYGNEEEIYTYNYNPVWWSDIYITSAKDADGNALLKS